MGKIGLKIKANLTNVNKLYPQNEQLFCWPVKVKCTACGEENPKWHLISEDDKVELATGTANFCYKCKCCSRENSLSIIPSNKVNSKLSHKKTQIDTVYLDEDDDKFKTIICFDCRGLEVIEFEPRDGWAVESGRKTFENVDLSGKDWCDYNDIENVPVEITNFESKLESIK